MPPIQYIKKEHFPERLIRITPQLRKLYCCGTMPDFAVYKCLVVIGARKYSEYGERVCQMLIKGLRGYPIIIVSGLALGIDSIAHEAALSNNILTVSVPGSPLDEKKIYPQSKLYLARKIVEKGGCLMSEYDFDEPMGPWVFPERNRIMAGLGDAVLIIEAAHQSGTSITARLALDYNKDVLAVPGSIFSPLSEGPHYLLKQGAIPVTNSQDIIEALGLTWKEKRDEQLSLYENSTIEEKEILALLPSSRDDLIRTLSKPTHEVQILISRLEIKGMIKESAGKIYII